MVAHPCSQQHEAQQQKVETTPVSGDGYMGKQKVADSHGEIGSGLKKEGDADTCHSTDDPRGRGAW